MSFQTPMRPVPGAYLNTPALASRFQPGPDPTRRQLFQPSRPTIDSSGNAGASASSGTQIGASTSGAVGTPVTPSAPRQDAVAPVVKAANAVADAVRSDENFPDLDNYIRQGVSSDYELSDPDSSTSPFHKTNMYPIPDQIFEHLNRGQLQTTMGLFAEINHAWVVIDNSLFLWDYTIPNPELVGYEEQSHSIDAVALVAPKPGIFLDSITHILAVATSAELILLGASVSATPSGNKSVALYQTKMNLPLRGTRVSVISGTADGRIFFGGSSDVDLNELYYQSEERWFSNRVGRINHTNPGWSSVVSLNSSLWSQKSPESLLDIVVDDSRKLVYTLSSTSTIRTYHMDSAHSLKKVIEKERLSCVRDITHMTNDPKLFSNSMRIVSISPISRQEASKLHLTALTNTGCRLFLSATNASAFYSTSTNLAPQSMQVQFIKLPCESNARFTNLGGQQGIVLKPSRKGSRFPPGYFLDFVDNNPDQNDLLFLSTPETGKIKNPVSAASTIKYPEAANWLEIGSRVEAVGLITKPFAAAPQPLGFGNELAVQFDEAPTEFAVLTNTGVHIIRRRRFVDTFAASIRYASGEEGFDKIARGFIQSYGRVETVSAALAVACGHGGDSRTGAPRTSDPATEDRAKTVFVDYGGGPTITETDGATLTTESVKLSSRHDALALYLSRLVRKLWKTPVITLGAAATGGIAVVSTIPVTKLAEVQSNINRLRTFLHENRTLIRGLSGPADLQRVTSRQEEVALQAEHQALHALQKLMESISEGISFVLMLFDERVSDIYIRLDTTAQEQFKALTFSKLFAEADGKELAKVVVKAIVNRNIESGSNVETVADALRRRCGSFCSPDDVVIFKAQEQLKRASEQSLSNSQRTLLHDSLRFFEKVAGSLTFTNLQAAVAQFVELKYYAGAVRLCLTVAREKDRGNTALSWLNDGKPPNDPREEVYNERKRCYNAIHEVLANLDTAASSEPETVDGKLTLIATKRHEAYGVVNESDDEVFHFDLYDWYLKQGWTQRILDIDSPHVVTFLQRLANEDVQHAELLCRFYTNRTRYYEAARVQMGLANSDLELGIKERIRLLSLAKSNAMVSTVGIARQEQQLLTHRVSDLLEVANVQDDLLERIKSDARGTDEVRAQLAASLDGKILGLSDLFNGFADPGNYYDICLLIYHHADYRNGTTINKTWSDLIDQLHTEVLEAEEAIEIARNEATMNGTAPPNLPQPPKPYESISAKIQNIAHHSSLDSFVFPIHMLLPKLVQYSVAEEQDNRIGAHACWPAQLFLSLDVSHDNIVKALEAALETPGGNYNQQGSIRVRLVELIVYAVDDWVADLRRRGGSKQAGTITQSVTELLKRCEGQLTPRTNNPGGADVGDLMGALRTLLREVATLADRAPMGSLRYL
ncbi:nucleoporin Nup157/170 [Emericellopsis atlantica]|uniref:Nucleoporin Nup157/170 n=1 Tax=Emericellopsis atlantica TaxID=2614577 RepID=A0A9P8CMP2_9HYPO|nr:nucleoporin Nup157/170 [Emericellopsis atlantica]KAG9252658.1 nucleoporin Nup157/170 [Emericellopsis atlantica]